MRDSHFPACRQAGAGMTKRDNVCYHGSMWYKKQHGYTLIELLTVIGILGVIGTVVASIIVMSLRGAKKSDTVELLRQNGDIALTQMVKAIRYAKTLDSPATCVGNPTVSSITISSVSDNGQTTYSCNANTISSNSASLLNTSIARTQSCSFSCRQATLNDAPTITIQFTLIPTNANSLVESNATLPFQSSVIMRNYSR